MHHQTRWTAQRIGRYLDIIEPLVYRIRQPLPPFRLKILDGPNAQPLIDRDVDDGDWPIIKSNSYWAEWLTDFTLRTYLKIPTGWDVTLPTALHLPLGTSGDFSHPEGLVYLDGQPFAACDRNHQEILLGPDSCDSHPHLLAIHGWTGRQGWQSNDPGSRPLMGQCSLVQIDAATRDFIKTARVALGVANAIDKNDPAHGRLLHALATTFNALNLQDPMGDDFYNSVQVAYQILQETIATAGSPLDVTLIAIGHAHIDVAWLWTLDQARRKAGRSFYTVIRLMEQFPEYHFTQSQPQLYEYVRQDYPDLFASIRDRIAEGHWEPIGGMWVEADCNLSGAESLARQFLLGRTFFREHFGPDAESPVLWLPDVFGYAWALPQLIKLAGLEYFFTIKIGWSQYNRMPYDSFWWQGIDGTKILTHFGTTPDTIGGYASTYNADATPSGIIGTWRNFQQKDLQHTLLMAYGYGDGGGGPTREMLENLQIMDAFPVIPQVQQGKVIEFFRAMEAEAGEALPTWNGELYLELHRGTYTTQSRNKRANRKSEFLLHDAEFLASYAAVISEHFTMDGNQAIQYRYPNEGLNSAWQLICLNQFHDIIPGSSIAEVYEDSLQQYNRVMEIGAAVKTKALHFIGQQFAEDLLLVNPTSFPQDVLVLWSGQLAEGKAILREDTAVITQTTEAGTLIDAGVLPPYSVTPLTTIDAALPSHTNELDVSLTHLENRFLYVTLDENSDINRIYDKVNQREVLPPDTIVNQLQAFEDRPLDWDAWDIDIYYDDKMILAEPATVVDVLEAGPLRVALQIKRRILNSTITQTVSLTHNQSQLDFDTCIDWQERHILLKAAFPVDILSPTATYEIQWGNVERPTHRNTSWDWARFETCAQKWVDLSEGNYGVSLLNDCKYGHDIRDNVMRISLLRGSTFPDPNSDLGEHQFAYSLRPHNGDWTGATIAAAYALNDPPFVYANDSPAVEPASGFPYATPLIFSSQSNVIIETIKVAEDGRGLIIRLYEGHRHRGPVTLTTSFRLQNVWRTNLLEDNQEHIQHEDNEFKLYFKPYEIASLRLE